MDLERDIFEKHPRGNPFPVRGIALVFKGGLVCVMVQGPCSNEWAEIISAPATAPDGLAGALDLTNSTGIAAASLACVTAEPLKE